MENQPQQPASEMQSNQKKPWYKRWFIIAIVVLILYAIGNSVTPSIDEAKKKAEEAKVKQEQNVQAEQVGNPKPAEQKVQEPAPIELSGVGQQASKKFALESGLSIFHMTHTGTSNFAVKLLDSDGQTVDLLVNEIGKFDGSKAIGVANKGEYILDISANSKWTVKIEQPRPATADAKPRTFAGKGQQVSPFINLNKGLTTFTLKHSGTSNFAVKLLDSNGQPEELLVNEIGKFDGSKAVGISSSGLYILDISANGDWTVSVE